jgi:hypothetical protein
MACDGCSEIPKIEIADVECLEGFKRIKEGNCFTNADGFLNLFCALGNISEKIGLLVDAQEKKGFASAVLHFRVEPGALTDNQLINFQISRSPLNYKVTGFGVSCLTFPSSAGIYTTDDTVQVKLYDFTGANQIGDTLTLSSVQLHDKHTDGGNVIGPNIGSGHIFGVKVLYDNTDAGAFTMTDIDIYIHVEPTELITEV